MHAPATVTKNNVVYKRYGSGMTGRHVYYAQGLEDTFKKLNSEKRSNYHYLYIFNRIQTLMSGLGVFNSEQKKDTHTAFRLNMAGTIMHYQMISGVAYISLLLLEDGDYRSDVENHRMAGLYLAELNDPKSSWRINGNPLTKVSTRHAAVNGDVEGIEEVLQFMPKMIEEAHKNKAQLEGEGFSLFYNPGRKGKDGAWVSMRDRMTKERRRKMDKAVRSEIIERLSAGIEAAANRQVLWTVQGSGSEVFVEALERLKLRRESIRAEGLDLSKHRAVFYNSHTNDMKIKDLLDEIAMGADAKAGLYSAKQIAANLRGHGQFHKAKMKDEDDKNNPSRKGEVKRMEYLMWDVAGGPAKLTGLGLAAAPIVDQVIQNWQTLGPMLQQVAVPSVTLAGALGIWGTAKFFRRSGPKNIALTKLLSANVGGSRRLDQLTESSPEAAALQLKRLRAGQAL